MRQMKDSGVKWIGEIPEGWEISRIKSIYKERTELSEMGNEELLSVSEYYGVKPTIDKIDEGEFLTRAESLVGYKKCFAGDFVSNIMLAWKGSFGTTNYDGIVSPAYCVYEPGDNICPYYYHYLFRTNLYTTRFKSYSKGIIDSRLRLYSQYFYGVEAILPPLPEQQAIASYLDKKCGEIDSLVGLQEEMIAELKAYKQSVITEAVTKGLDPDAKMKDSGVEWIGEVPEGWELIRLRFLCNINTGGQDTVNRVDDGIYPFFVRSPKIERINTYCYDGEAIMMAGDGVGAGRVFHHYNGKFDCHQRVYYLYDFQIVEGMFLYYYLSSNFYKLIDAGSAKSTVDSVRLPMLTNFPVLIPTLQVQQQIATYLDTKTSEIDQLITIKQQKITELKEYKKSLIYECVTGKKEILQTTN